MTIIQGILLGILQGVAEFLPISSSGHLAIVQKLFGLEELPLLFDVMLHLATLLAVIIYFRKKIGTLLCAFARLIARRPVTQQNNSGNLSPVTQQNNSTTTTTADFLTGSETRSRKTILAIILTTLVTGCIGIWTSKLISNLYSDLLLKVTCAGFILTAILLITSSFIEKNTASTKNANDEKEGIKWYEGLVVGLMQGFGTFPGISRSGSTIAGSLFCGMDRATAGEYSFIVSIPAILGAFILELKDFAKVGVTVGIAPVVAGCAAAFAWGYLSLSILMKIIKKGRLEWFAVYLIPLGIVGMILL